MEFTLKLIEAKIAEREAELKGLEAEYAVLRGIAANRDLSTSGKISLTAPIHSAAVLNSEAVAPRKAAGRPPKVEVSGTGLPAGSQLSPRKAAASSGASNLKITSVTPSKVTLKGKRPRQSGVGKAVLDYIVYHASGQGLNLQAILELMPNANKLSVVAALKRPEGDGKIVKSDNGLYLAGAAAVSSAYDESVQDYSPPGNGDMSDYAA